MAILHYSYFIGIQPSLLAECVLSYDTNDDTNMRSIKTNFECYQTKIDSLLWKHYTSSEPIS